MSLNGLDTPTVVEAYQSALADAGGWFLLHYTARDEVALLDRGTGGVPEVRSTIDNYNETSPLYGFLHYRRRKVILRFMPEGLSRLILARSNVQFQSVLDKFSPHDTVLPLAQASDLNESALSSACLLHTASGSITSSSSSLRRRRLMEITEDAEENGAKEESKGQPELQSQSQSQPQPPPAVETRKRSGSQKSEATIVPPPSTTSPEVAMSSPDLRPPPSRASSRSPISRGSPSESHSSNVSPTSPRSPESVTSEHSRYGNILDEFPRPSEETRMSTQSARPSLRDLERAAGYTPKVKLGPRPSLDQSGRPRTSGSSRNPDQRPVASMPAGMRSSSVRKPPSINEVPRPRSQGSSFATKPNSRAPPIPPLLVPPSSISISRPPLSPGAKSMGALSTSSGLTPEKERLMKALQQRKKQMAKRAEQMKKKQAVADEEEEAQETKMKEAVQTEEENKENIHQASELAESPKIEAEKVPEPETKLEAERPQDSRALGSLAEPRTPVSEPSVVPEQHQDLAPSGSEEDQPSAYPEAPVPEDEQVYPELIADATVFDSECPSSHTSDPSADTTFSTDRAETPQEAAKSETSQTFFKNVDFEVETHEEPAGSAISDPIEAKDDLVPPSANVQVPLTEEAADATPEPANASPVQQPEDAPGVDEQKAEAATEEAAPAKFPETLTIPIFPPVESSSPDPSKVEPPVAPVLVSIEPVPQDETTPEEQQISALAPPVPPLDERRRKNLEPIQVPTQEFSDDDCLLSDDSLMEELRSATVQEARPVSVKSPIGGDQSWKGSRAVSSPYLTSPSAMQALAVGRSVSSSHVDNASSTPVLVAKKINVSSGISSRIKALEKFSSRDGTPSGPTPVTGPSASSSFEELRKRASVSFPNGTIPDFSRAPSVNHHDARPVSSNRRTNSISVTARIVRDNSVSPGSSGVEPSESDVLSLQASPLTVEQYESNDQPNSTIDSSAPVVENRTMSTSSAESSRQVTPVSRPASRLSLSSRSKVDENLQSASPTDEKKGSRASRLMRRMSSMTSTSRRSIIGALSPPVKEVSAGSSLGNSAISKSSSRQTLSEPIEIGEVNVQFPETLLWKRRFMRIDEDGYVVLTPGTNDASARNMIKRYHLSDFRTPCLPDEDMQELPNSILLDFLDGSTLQCACESRQGQSWTLQS
ncbi:hypothetical protein F1880_002598 [Penicillium rolfsii]|nr:hypothetical protein F1880_002598 [Penicillium rolfsii]